MQMEHIISSGASSGLVSTGGVGAVADVMMDVLMFDARTYSLLIFIAMLPILSLRLSQRSCPCWVIPDLPD